MEHVVEYYLGGRGKFWNNAYKTSASLAESSIDVGTGDKTGKEGLSRILT